MATTILDTFATTSDAYPANFAVSAGSNRRAYLAVFRTSGLDANPPTAASIGGVSVSPLAVADDGASMDVVCALFEWTESQIASMSGSAVTVTGGAGANYATVYWSVQGATQSAITPVTDITPGTTSSVSLVRVADSYTVALTIHDINSGAYTSLSNPSQTGTFNITNGVIAYAGAADTARTVSFTWSHGTSRENAAIALNIAPAASGPAISSTSDDTPTDGSTLTINGSGFGASQGAGGVTAAGTGWTETSWSDTAIQVTVALGNNKYNTNVSLVVTDNSSNASSGYNVQIQPASGKAYVNLSGTLATEGDRITAIPDLASGDQLEISNVVGGTISDVTVYADASFSVVAGVTAFDVRVNDGTWSSVATQYVAEPGSQADRGLVRNLVRDLTKTLVRALVG